MLVAVLSNRRLPLAAAAAVLGLPDSTGSSTVIIAAKQQSLFVGACMAYQLYQAV